MTNANNTSANLLPRNEVALTLRICQVATAARGDIRAMTRALANVSTEALVTAAATLPAPLTPIFNARERALFQLATAACATLVAMLA